MKKLLLTTAAVVVLATSSTYASEEGSFYIKANAGLSRLNKTSFSVSNNKMKGKAKNDAFFGLGVGYYLMDNVRTDIMIDHLFNPIQKVNSKINVNGRQYNVNGKVKYNINSVLVNGYVDLFDVSVAKVFVGAGIGASRISSKDTGSITNISSGSKTPISSKVKAKNYLSYAAHIGASSEVAPGIHAELAYSFRHFAKIKNSGNLRGHHVAAGVRFSI